MFADYMRFININERLVCRLYKFHEHKWTHKIKVVFYNDNNDKIWLQNLKINNDNRYDVFLLSKIITYFFKEREK